MKDLLLSAVKAWSGVNKHALTSKDWKTLWPRSYRHCTICANYLYRIYRQVQSILESVYLETLTYPRAALLLISLFCAGKDKEIQQFGRGRRRGGRLVGSEAEDFVLREQLGTADQGAQTTCAWQRGLALRGAQAREASTSHYGACQGSGNSTQGIFY